MKKTLLLFLILLVFGSSIAQSKHGFTTGLDSTANKHKILSQTEYRIRVDSNSMDTSFSRTKTFNEDGFLMEIKEVDFINRHLYNPKIPLNLGIFNSIQFEYNENGYLIYEHYSWGGPITSYGNDTIKKVLTQTWKLIENLELLESEVIHTTYPDEEYMSTYQYFYRSDGQKQRIINTYQFFPFGISEIYQTITEYFYNEDGLLSQVITKHDSGRQYVCSYVYEFFE